MDKESSLRYRDALATKIFGVGREVSTLLCVVPRTPEIYRIVKRLWRLSSRQPEHLPVETLEAMHADAVEVLAMLQERIANPRPPKAEEILADANASESVPTWEHIFCRMADAGVEVSWLLDAIPSNPVTTAMKAEMVTMGLDLNANKRSYGSNKLAGMLADIETYRAGLLLFLARELEYNDDGPPTNDAVLKRLAIVAGYFRHLEQSGDITPEPDKVKHFELKLRGIVAASEDERMPEILNDLRDEILLACSGRVK